jgi:hypothetical protein
MTRASASRTAPVVDVLDHLDVTDTVFHDLKHTSRLAAELLDRIPDGIESVLLIGPNVALSHVLQARGLNVVLWHVHGVAVTEDLVDRVARRGSVDELLRPEPGDGCFDVVVAPYVLELSAAEPAATLGSLCRLVSQNGSLLVVAHRSGSLQARLDGIRGRASLGRPEQGRTAPTWSWPAGVRRHVVDESLMTRWARAAGLRLVTCAAVLDRNPVEQISALKFHDWLAAQGAHALKAAAPMLRDTMVAHLRPMRAGRPVPQLGADPLAFPRVSVVVFASDADRLGSVVAHLENQTYPRERTELVIVWPESAGPVPDAPGTLPRLELTVSGSVPSASAANEAFRAANGEIVALTSDSCDIPPGWVESGVRELGGWTMAVAGRVLVQAQSAAAFLDLPGRRRYPRPDGLYSWTNSFYVRQPLLEVDGFVDPDPGVDDGRAGATWGWDSTAAARLTRSGYHIAESNQVYLHRNFPPACDRRWIRDEYEYARGIPFGIRWHPGLRRSALYRRTFGSERTFAFNSMVVGLAVGAIARRRTPAVLGTLLYVRSISEYLDVWPPPAWRTSARHVRGVVLRNVIWSAGLVRGSIAARRVVL